MEEKVVIIKEMAKSVLEGENKGISLDEYNELIKCSKSQDERDLYKVLYEHFLGNNQSEVIKDGKF